MHSFLHFQGLKMKLVICNNTKENLSWESEKINVKFHNNCEKKAGKFWKIDVREVILRNLTFIFSGSHMKFSLVLLQITNYIFSPWKILNRMQYALNYSGTRFLSTESENYSISWWIPPWRFITVKICVYQELSRWVERNLFCCNNLKVMEN